MSAGVDVDVKRKVEGKRPGRVDNGGLAGSEDPRGSMPHTVGEGGLTPHPCFSSSLPRRIHENIQCSELMKTSSAQCTGNSGKVKLAGIFKNSRCS